MDTQELNDIDHSITLGILNVEQSLKIVQVSHPSSPTLALSILQVHLWNYVQAKLKTNSINKTRISSTVMILQSYDTLQNIPDTTTKDMTKINNNFRQTHTNLKDIMLKAHALRHEHLMRRQQESK